MNFTEQQLSVRDAILVEGMSRREAARVYLGSSTRESTIRGWIKDGLLGENVNTAPAEEDLTDLTQQELDLLCENPDWSVSNLAKRLRAAQRSNNQLRKVQRELFDGGEDVTSLETVLNNLALNIGNTPVKQYNPAFGVNADDATLEVLVSDSQIGKLTRHYNTEVAKKAFRAYGEGILEAIEERKHKFKLERIVLAILGDLVEDSTKHGISSAISCDTGLSEQLHDAIEGIWTHILQPLALIGVPVDVICVVGNHGSSTHKGMGTFKEGRYSYDYVIHKTLQSFCKLCKYNHVEFDIPDGVFAHTDFYGMNAIYEHGYTNNITEKGMVDQMRKRGAQLKIHPTYWRQGDKHHSIVYGQGEQVLNGAFFGNDEEGIEYSGILGYSGVPSQTIMFHTKEDRVGRVTVKDIIHIQLAM